MKHTYTIEIEYSSDFAEHPVNVYLLSRHGKLVSEHHGKLLSSQLHRVIETIVRIELNEGHRMLEMWRIRR